jgi:hypothetical protein
MVGRLRPASSFPRRALLVLEACLWTAGVIFILFGSRFPDLSAASGGLALGVHLLRRNYFPKSPIGPVDER